MTKLEHCPVCGSGAAKFRHFGRFRRWITRRPWAATLDECGACGHVFSNPQPSLAELGRYYQSDYCVFKSPTLDPQSVVADMERRGAKTYRNLPVIHGGTFLDVGCAIGDSLAIMQALGMHVRGVEVSPTAAQIARERGLDVFIGTLEQAPLPDAAFDVIGILHVLEHIQDPIPVLEKCHRLLKPGGRLVISLPNIRSIGFETYGVNWIGFDLPRHVHQFSPESLKAALQRVGFRDMTAITEAYAAFLQSCHIEQLRRRWRLPRRVFARSEAIRQRAKELAERATASDRGDNLTLIATRSPEGDA